MKKPLKYCVNGDGRPVYPPSWVLCKECFAKLDGKFKALNKTASEYGNDEIRWPDGLQHYSRVQSSNRGQHPAVVPDRQA